MICDEDAWLTPDGKLIQVGKFNHNNYAQKFLAKEAKVDTNCYISNDGYPYRVLHYRGWIRIKINNYQPFVQILGDSISLEKPMYNTIDPAMTSEQMKIAKLICEENDTTLFKAINDKRFW